MSLELPHLLRNPHIPPSCYIDPSARINGNVTMGEHCSVWFNVSMRGDVHEIVIGAYTNVQDNCVFHTSHLAHALHIGNHVSFGHGVIAHGCSIGDHVLVGMGSIVMDAAKIGDLVLIGAGSLVTEGKDIPSGVLALGRPAKVIRDLKPQEIEMIRNRSLDYAAYAEAYRKAGKFKDWSQNLYNDNGTHSKVQT